MRIEYNMFGLCNKIRYMILVFSNKYSGHILLSKCFDMKCIQQE